MLVNCTPHSLTIIIDGQDPLILQPSGICPRLAPTRQPMMATDGIATVRTTLGAAQGLPAAQDGIYLIVSALVLGACPDRSDLRSPGELVRDAGGAVVGCRGLCV